MDSEVLFIEKAMYIYVHTYVSGLYPGFQLRGKGGKSVNSDVLRVMKAQTCLSEILFAVFC